MVENSDERSLLTLDNTLLSEVKNPLLRGRFAANSKVEDLVRRSLSENTKKAYLSDLKHFFRWGGKIPSDDIRIAEYLAEYSEGLSPVTLRRRIVSLSKAHRSAGLENPCESELVKATMRGIFRSHGRPPKQAKPLLKLELFRVIDSIPADISGLRDKALLLTGWACGFRASELVGLNIDDLTEHREGFVLQVRRSKVDQECSGRLIGLPFGTTHNCPVEKLKVWLSYLQASSGPLFRPINKHGHISRNRLTSDAVSKILCKRLQHARIPALGFSSHSLRAGFITSAAIAGIPTFEIRSQTGHASDRMLNKYIRVSNLFHSNPLRSLL